jgi:dolichyl-phosphate-mannose-protein mannosyltransferase
LIHVNTSVALAFSGRLLPEWGHNQHEIVGDVMVNQPNTIFNVEEHRYTRSKLNEIIVIDFFLIHFISMILIFINKLFADEDEKDRQLELMTTDFIPLEPVVMGFWEKFFELQIRMLFISNENVQNHMYTSSPWEWLVLTRGIAYWVSPESNVI